VKITGQKNIKTYGAEELTILNPCHMPDPSIIAEYQEPMVLSTIISPDEYLGDMLSIIMERRGQTKDQTYVDSKRIMFKVIFPLSEVIVDFFDELKSISSGYASFDYEDYGYEISNLVKIEVYLNGKVVEELTQMAHVSKARAHAKRIAARLKEEIPPQLFLIAIQAKVWNYVCDILGLDAVRILFKYQVYQVYQVLSSLSSLFKYQDEIIRYDSQLLKPYCWQLEIGIACTQITRNKVG
jgi:translation elongation factor EF-4